MIEDPEFRSTVHEAVDSARSVFAQINASKAPAKKLADDRKLQNEVKQALETLQQATSALVAEQQTAPRRRKRRGRRLLAWLGIGTLISFVACPPLRTKALDKLFGAEEEFQYSPPPAPPAPPAPVEPAPAATESQASTA
jgi:hypothetical protein